ncbi:hypothetical protein CBR_g45829 [Chara braunii]|uniref:Uncharacterized protein n=1 Tax=Chara braunii TaxID=69332 RepID=A0A388LZH6_CHABU|nr:hypothetical protein CBR_g45829 [Chara braunii]|eukprot:GBG87675.1 hypothetical protein CBR_g45829 [Chara braunii]
MVKLLAGSLACVALAESGLGCAPDTLVDTRGGKSATPYTQAQEEQFAAILRERREKKEKEFLELAKLKEIAEEQTTKKKKLEEEMLRLQQKEEEKRRVAEEEEAAEEEEVEEEPLERRHGGERGETSGTKAEDKWMEKKISEWVANLSLGEDEEAMLYVPKEEKEAFARELEAKEDPLERQTMEDEKRLEWKLHLAREKKRREEANRMAKEVEKIQACRREVQAQEETPAKLDKILGYLEILSEAWLEEQRANKGQEVTLHSIRTGFREFARDVVTHIATELKRLKEGGEKFCAGTIEGAKVVAEVEVRPRKEPVKLKFPDSYSWKKDDNFDNWEASINTYVYLQHIAPEEQVQGK